jgi:sugar/nucleoside kinase (ribokinase family)
MSASSPDVVVAGHICLDLIPDLAGLEGTLESILVPGTLVRVGAAPFATGGACSNTGMAFHRLGVATELMGKIGTDYFGQGVLKVLENLDPALAEGMILDPRAVTSYTIVINPPNVDRMFLHCAGANDTFCAADIDYDKVARARLLHFGYPQLMARMFADGAAELTEMYRRAKGRGVTCSLDVAWPAGEAARVDWLAVFQRTLPFVDVFLPNFEEALFCLDRPRFDQMDRAYGVEAMAAHADAALLDELAGKVIEMGTPVVIVKLGEQGIYLRTTDDASRLAAMGPAAPAGAAEWTGRQLLAPAFEVEVAGTTGAGDCTIAGFLTGLLRGIAPEAALVAAAAVGACNVERPDASSGVPHWDTVQQRLAAGWPAKPVALDLPGWTHDQSRGIYLGPQDQAAR